MNPLQVAGRLMSERFRRWMPDPFVFALVLTLVAAGASLALTGAGPIDVIDGWYGGFWRLLDFGMQMVLMLATGFAIALSPPAAKLVNLIARAAHTPARVYFVVVIVGALLNLVSWGWGVITAVLARELARRVSGIDYAYLVACVYMSGQVWVAGVSSSIPLVLGTDGNFMIEQGLLDAPIAASQTLGSSVNAVWLAAMLLSLPLIALVLRPHREHSTEIHELHDDQADVSEKTVAELASRMTGTERTLSNRLNNSSLLATLVAVAGLVYVVRYFATRGFDLNLNIVIFTFLMFGLLVHRTAIRYVVAMRRACSEISGIVYQYPFYAGIMGIMLATGLGVMISDWIVSRASLTTLPLFAQAAGAFVNFAIPSAGGEWAVIGPSLVDAAKTIGADLPAEQREALIARVAMAAAYGETSTNLLQPFFLLAIMPVMAAGVRVQARDVMGFLVLPFCYVYLLTAALIMLVPL